MSLAPMLYSDWWEDLDRPHSIIDQHFGLPVDPEEILHHRGGGGSGGGTLINRHAENLGYPFFRRMRRRYHPFHHALARRFADNKVGSLCNTDRDRFVVTLDVKQFTLDEITVKTIEKSGVIVVEAKHEEKEDEHGWISRQFTRKYNVPSSYDIEQIETLLSSDGILTIQAPRKKLVGDNEKIIKIRYTGEPAIIEKQTSKSIEDHQSDESSRDGRDHPQQHQQQGRGPMSQQRGKKITVKGVV